MLKNEPRRGIAGIDLRVEIRAKGAGSFCESGRARDVTLLNA